MADIRAWSTTPSSNTDYFPEGMAPSAVNDGGRAVQAGVAQFIGDNGGALNTGGSNVAMTVTLNTSPPSLANGLSFTFRSGFTVPGACTLTVTPASGSAFAAKKIRTLIAGTESDLLPGMIIGSGVYQVTYRTSADSGAGAWILQNPEMPSGSILQSWSGTYTTNADLTTTIPLDDTAPTSTEGTQIISVSATASSTTNKFRVNFSGFGAVATAGDTITVAVFNGTNVQYATTVQIGTANYPTPIAFEFEYTPGSVSTTTVNVRVGGAVGTVRMNGRSTGRFFGGIAKCSLIVEEVKA